MINITKEPWAIMPTKAHREDAGWDLYTPIDLYINGGGSTEVNTGIAMEIPYEMFGEVRSKSGLMFKHNILIGQGTVDCGYTGNIHVKIFNLGSQPYSFKAGEKIAQLVLVHCEMEKLKVVESLEKTERGSNGFGSTGK